MRNGKIREAMVSHFFFDEPTCGIYGPAYLDAWQSCGGLAELDTECIY